MNTTTVKRSVRVADGLKVATLEFGNGVVLDRFTVKTSANLTQFEVYDNLTGNLLYSRHAPELAANDVAVLNQLVTKNNDHEE